MITIVDGTETDDGAETVIDDGMVTDDGNWVIWMGIKVGGKTVGTQV
jgi:hypothetical protein